MNEKEKDNENIEYEEFKEEIKEKKEIKKVKNKKSNIQETHIVNSDKSMEIENEKKQETKKNDSKEKIDKLKENFKSNLNDKLGNFKTTKFYNFLHTLETEKRILLMACVSLSLVVIFLGWSVMKLSATHKTIVLPPKVDKEFWMISGELSSAYFEQVGFYIADRVMSVSPQSAETSYDTLLPFLSDDPKELSVIRAKLVEQADFIKKENIYQVFYPLNVAINNKDGNFIVTGTLRKFVGELYIHEVKSTLTVYYSVSSGRLKINNLEIK